LLISKCDYLPWKRSWAANGRLISADFAVNAPSGCKILIRLDVQYPLRKGTAKSFPPFPWPTKQSLPPKCNPPLEHVPPWLNEDQQQRHIELATEQEQKSRPRSKAPRPRVPSSRQRRENALKRAAAKNQKES
jgi:hypothetical protein